MFAKFPPRHGSVFHPVTDTPFRKSSISNTCNRNIHLKNGCSGSQIIKLDIEVLFWNYCMFFEIESSSTVGSGILCFLSFNPVTYLRCRVISKFSIFLNHSFFASCKYPRHLSIKHPTSRIEKKSWVWEHKIAIKIHPVTDMGFWKVN